MLELSPPAERTQSYAAHLCELAFEQAFSGTGGSQRALELYIAAADQCLGMIWWSLMTSGHAADVRPISAMRKALRNVR